MEYIKVKVRNWVCGTERKKFERFFFGGDVKNIKLLFFGGSKFIAVALAWVV